MPENKNNKNKELKLNINDFENDCEKVKFTADEYLHGELSETENDFIEKHISECKDCFDFIETEKKYLDEIKFAEYIPEISVAKSVMDKIIENRMIIDRPPKKRFVPVGFIAAAAVIILMFAVSRGGALNMFMKSSKEKSANNLENAVFDAQIINGTAANFDNSFVTYGEVQDDMDEDELELVEEKMEIFAADSGADNMDLGEPEAAAYSLTEAAVFAVEEAAPAPAPEAPAAGDKVSSATDSHAESGKIAMIPTEENLSPAITIDEFFAANTDTGFDQILWINYADISGIKSEIFKDIEIYRIDPDGRFDIIEKKYGDLLLENLLKNNIIMEESPVLAGIAEYIGIIYY